MRIVWGQTMKTKKDYVYKFHFSNGEILKIYFDKKDADKFKIEGFILKFKYTLININNILYAEVEELKDNE